MCRLLGWVSREPAPLAELLGEAALGAFLDLSAQHGDGWGLATLDAGGVSVRKAAEPAYRSAELAAAVREVPARAGVLHLRWATPGLPVRPANSHPFRYDGAAFAHNGAIRPVDGLLGLLSPGECGSLEGDTDSERYFRIVLDRLPVQGPAGAFRSAIADIGAALTPSSLNAMLLTPDALTVVACFDRDSAPTLGGPAAVDHGPGGPPERLRGYFDLRYRDTDEVVVVASSGWPQDGWTLLPNGRALVVDPDDLSCTLADVGTLPAGARRRAAMARVATADGAPPEPVRPTSNCP